MLGSREACTNVSDQSLPKTGLSDSPLMCMGGGRLRKRRVWNLGLLCHVCALSTCLGLVLNVALPQCARLWVACSAPLMRTSFGVTDTRSHGQTVFARARQPGVAPLIGNMALFQNLRGLHRHSMGVCRDAT